MQPKNAFEKLRPWKPSSFESKPFECVGCGERYISIRSLKVHWVRKNNVLHPDEFIYPEEATARDGLELTEEMKTWRPPVEEDSSKRNKNTPHFQDNGNRHKTFQEQIPQGWSKLKIIQTYDTAPSFGISKKSWIKKWNENFPQFKVSRQKISQWRKKLQ